MKTSKVESSKNSSIFIQAARRLTFFCAAFVILVKVVFVLGYIPSESMRPLLEPGDIIIGFRLPFVFSNPMPKRGDVVEFVSTVDGQTILAVKRVIAVAGDTVRLKDNSVYLNGERLTEVYALGKTEAFNEKDFNVPDGCVFLLGDNRENSYDSRYWEDPYLNIDRIFASYLFSSNIIRLW